MSWDADNLVDQLQDDMLGRLLADGWFADIAIFALQQGVVESDIVAALSTYNPRGDKIGACIVVLPPEIEVPDDDPGALRMDAVPSVRVLESPAVNRADGGTGKKLYRIALRVLRLFHKWDPGTVSRMSADKRAVLPYNAPAGSVGCNCRFRCRGALGRPAKVGPVAISGDASAVSLACGTSGASIYYTIDGSLPRPGTAAEPSTAERYGVTMTALDGTVITTLDGTSLDALPAPFAAAAGTLVRAAAYHPERQAGDAAAHQF